MNLQEQLNRIQEMMGFINSKLINETSNKSLVMQNKYNEEIEKTQLYNYLLNRYEIQEIDGRYKLFDKIDNRSYFTNNNQSNKTIDSLIWNIGSEIDKMGEKELIKIFKSFCKKINLNWDCDRDKETMYKMMIRQVVHYFFLKIRKEI